VTFTTATPVARHAPAARNQTTQTRKLPSPQPSFGGLRVRTRLASVVMEVVIVVMVLDLVRQDEVL
jgi:hypothetical protein